MRTILFTAAFCLLVCALQGQEKTGYKEIVISDYRNKEKPAANLSEHKVLDVVVNRITGTFGDSYNVQYYRIEGDSLRKHGATYGAQADFDRAYYRWENDTMVAIILHNSESGNEEKIKVFGKGSTSGMIWDEE